MKHLLERIQQAAAETRAHVKITPATPPPDSAVGNNGAPTHGTGAPFPPRGARAESAASEPGAGTVSKLQANGGKDSVQKNHLKKNEHLKKEDKDKWAKASLAASAVSAMSDGEGTSCG